MHKIEGSSPDSLVVVQEVHLKKDDDSSEPKSQDETTNVSQPSPVENRESVETKQEDIEPETEETATTSQEKADVSDAAVQNVQKSQDDENCEAEGEVEAEAEVDAEAETEAAAELEAEAKVEAAAEAAADAETEAAAPANEIEETTKSKEKSTVEDENVTPNDEISSGRVENPEETTEQQTDEQRTEEGSADSVVVPTTEQMDSGPVSPVSFSETSEPLIIKDIEKLQLENDREVIDSDTSEAYLTPTENQENLADIKSKEMDKMDESVVNEDVEQTKKTSVDVEDTENENETEKDNENERGEETVKNSNCSTSVIESTETGEKKVDVEEERAETVVTSELSSERCAVDSVTEEKSAVINDNGEKVTNEKHSREPSTISTNVSDNQSDTPVRTEAVVEVTDNSVCSNSDIQSSVDNATQVPNPKQQIPTISTVCDANNKNMPDGVPQIVSSTVVARDNSLLNDLTPDHVDAHRRSSLPAVSTETATDDNLNSNEPPSLPVPLRKTSSPQKRPRSASTSTQVDPNHFGEDNRSP